MQTGRVFVSHTSDAAQSPAGRSFVQAALDAVVRAGLVPVDMRYFAAGDRKPADYCRQRVRGCDAYIGVVGFQYGSIVPGTAVSYTELEFAEAGAAGLPRLVFLLADVSQVPADLVDADRGAVDAFRHRLRAAGLTARDFTSAANLELEVFHALTDLDDSTLPAAPDTAASVRYSLPSDTAAFTGRDQEVDLITGAVAAAAGQGVVMIYAIDGMPGLGKTALAVHAAHLLRPQFADRQLFIDLHGHTPGQQPVTPAAALAGLLAVVGVDARSLPADLAGRHALWRDRMAGQQALLVLDNAASSQQVAPLLPGDQNCLVLVTSRRHLGDLPGVVVPVMLDALQPDEAAEMFRRLAPRATRDPGAEVARLVQLAGFLPLAISLLARVYLRHPAWTIADLARETEASLLTLTAETGSIAAAFGVSYRSLTAGQQEFFRVLGLHPGTTIDARAAAALAGLPVPEAARLLDALHGEGLLTEPGYRRYGMHDLIRAYSRHRGADIPVADRAQMLAGLLDYYQDTAARAEAQLARQTRAQPVPPAGAGPAGPPDLADRMQALAWLRAERVNLLACIDHASRTGAPARVVALTSAMAGLLRQDGPWSSAITRHETAVSAAQQLGDRPSEADVLIRLGALFHLTGDAAGATEALRRAQRIYRDLGDQLGQANALTNLGAVWRRLDDYSGAMAAHVTALGMYRDLGDLLGQANALNELGAVHSVTGDYPAAITALEAGLALYRELGDVLGQADNLYRLGVVRRFTENRPAAMTALERALAMYRELGDRLGQANTLNHLGALRRDAGDYRAAAAGLAVARRIHRNMGNRSGQAVALGYLGSVRRLTGDFPGASDALAEALRIFRDIGHRGGEVEVLNELGTLHRVRGSEAEAAASHREALRVAREIKSAWDEAHALAGLGRCDQATGHAADAETKLRQAYQMFQRMGAAETPGLAAELDALAGERAG
jgi:tetratricopeptide (TPR) repeat protein